MKFEEKQKKEQYLKAKTDKFKSQHTVGSNGGGKFVKRLEVISRSLSFAKKKETSDDETDIEED